MSNLADRIYAVRLSIGNAAMEIENVDGADAGAIFDSMPDLDEIEPELRALLAECDALKERERQLKQLAYQWNENAKDTGFVRIPNYAPQVYENCADELQSILNPTGER